MEFSQVGAHCALPSCQERDFLPFVCQPGCRKSFCLRHRGYAEHACPNAPKDAHAVVDCPKCGQPVVAAEGQDANVAVWNHIQARCPPTQLKVACSQRGCTNQEILKLRCSACKKLFCVVHRQQLDHACAALPKQVAASAPAASNSPSLSARVQNLMSGVRDRFFKSNPEKASAMFRQRAVGDEKVAPERRFYAEVNFPYGSKVEPKYMFFNNAWSAGRALDEIAKLGGIVNNNDKPGVDKLFLWNLSTGEKMSNTLVLRDLPSSGMVLLLETETGVLAN